ncbi:hypothetical protein GCM10027447_19970 [Glycomyces halotolerans]
MSAAPRASDGSAALARNWPLGVVAVAVIVAEGAGLLPRWPGLTHLVALPPLDLFADMRLLLAMSVSWPAFIAAAAGLFSMRVVTLAVLLGGPSRERLRFAAAYYGALWLPMLAAALADFVGHALVFARMFWPAVAAVAVLALMTAALPWRGRSRMRAAWPEAWRGGLRVGIVGPYGAALVAIGAAAHLWPALIAPLIALSAATTAMAAALLRRPPRPGGRLRLAAAAAVFVVAATLFVATRGVEQPPPPEARAGSLMVMSGINSSSGNGAVFELDPRRLGYTCDQLYHYSYAGPGDGQPRGRSVCPVRSGAPFNPEDTRRPVIEQAIAFSRQVEDLPRPLVVLSHSHSAWVLWLAVSRGMAPEVDAVILIGPFQESVLGYPPAGEEGPGAVAGDLMRWLRPMGRAVGLEYGPDDPASLETLADPSGPGRIFSRPLPDEVRALSVSASTDLPLMPSGWRLPVDRNACPVRAPHPYLPDAPATLDEINRFLDGRAPRTCPAWRDWGAVAVQAFGAAPQDPQRPYANRRRSRDRPGR